MLQQSETGTMEQEDLAREVAKDLRIDIDSVNRVLDSTDPKIGNALASAGVTYDDESYSWVYVSPARRNPKPPAPRPPDAYSASAEYRDLLNKYGY